MSLIWRSRLIAIGAVLVAVWLASELADTGYALPTLFGGLAAAMIAMYLTGVPIETLALAGALFGYIVGNRGFAQLMPIPRIPLLPAELVLLVAGGCIAVRAILSHTFPFRRDFLNVAIFVWLIAGTIRVVFDIRPYGLLAVRDYAMVYYAAFFYLAQWVASDARSRRFLVGVLIASAVVEPIAAILNEYYPAFVFGELSIGGIPLIFFKGDLAFTFAAMSALILSLSTIGPLRLLLWAVGAIEISFVLAGQNRASALGAVAALAWLLVSPLRRFVALQTGVVLLGLLVLAAATFLFQNEQAIERFNGVEDRVRSLTDAFGHGKYVSTESAMKGDNNRFRSLWWSTVYDELMAENPVFGLGFGYDLARGFLEKYNPDLEDFNARSPHSIVMTTLGRMGFVGLAVLLVVVTAFAIATWRALRHPETLPSMTALWCSCWVIFVSACFGVVLEGPMGAVVFWTLLGIANAARYDEKPVPEPTPKQVATAEPLGRAAV